MDSNEKKEKVIFAYADITKSTTKNFAFKSKPDMHMEIKKLIEELDSEVEHYRAAVANDIVLENQTKHIKIEKESNFTIYEQKIREVLIQNLKKYKTIAVQQGNNLDINASIYAIQKFMLDNGIIKDANELIVKRVPAGKILEKAVNVDNGKLKGILISDDNNNISINGNENLGEHSACSMLARLGFYVPKAIVENADMVYGEKIIDPRYGLVLARELCGEVLFRFAEEKRDGRSLLELDLSDEELEEYGLTKFYEKRKEDIDKGSQIVDKYAFEVNGIKCVIAPVFIPYGSYISYNKGAKYYCSMQEHKSGYGCTLAITANPRIEEGVLPEEVIEWGRTLRKQNGEGVFVGNNNDKIIVGGLKNEGFSIYSEKESREAIRRMTGEIKKIFGIDNELEEQRNIMEILKNECESVTVMDKDKMKEIMRRELESGEVNLGK